MEKNQVLTLVLVPLLFLSLAATGTNFLIASTSEEEEASSSGLPFTTPETTTSASASTTLTPNATEALNASNFVRTAVMLFGIKPSTPDVVTWVNLPEANITGGEIANAERLEASNNVTSDEIGVLFITIPNSTNQLNQQIEACAMDIVSRTPACDNAFQSNVSRATLLQIMLPDDAAVAAAEAGIGQPSRR
jgi:hypothetical protein